MSVTLVHYFKTEVRTVQNVRPGVDYTTLRVKDGLVEVETVQVECHGRYTKSSEPDTDYRPCTQEEVQGTAVVERCILEDQTTEVAVGCNDVVSFFLLTELVTVVLRFGFSGLTYQRRGYERTVHCGEQRTTEYTSHTKHVEGVHQDVVLCLEYDHEVERTRNTQRHTIREGTLTDGVDEEYCSCCCYGSRERNTDPGTHTEAVRKFPLTTHVAENTNEEVENYQLVRATVVQPLI